MSQQIIAMGGGGFSMEPENLLLDRYILEQTHRTTPKVCFLPTASGDSENYINRFYASFNKLDCTPSHLSLFKPHVSDLKEFILEKDVIYVGGGNTFNLLTLWKAWGLDVALKEAWESGVILAGLSAGSICWFEQGITDSFSGSLSKLDCLGFLPGSNCPHYDGEENRRPSFHDLVLNREVTRGLAADDGVAFHFKGNDLYETVSSRPTAMGYHVYNRDGEVLEETIKPVFLGE
ncbi:peptidase E [Pseudalkalibacillus caeni]|uniref:Peptidase E n=1 Tax=Exobacillus caeni TaxID=2574798 RepID=A0A5R9F9K3_9BACL|nr:peptidase E [Pseudalkalibacillus caeni]TLS37543.1 peptidase E [Pseudalkalibacillus caeni]